jgi:hypothetical protein
LPSLADAAEAVNLFYDYSWDVKIEEAEAEISASVFVFVFANSVRGCIY